MEYRHKACVNSHGEEAASRNSCDIGLVLIELFS